MSIVNVRRKKQPDGGGKVLVSTVKNSPSPSGHAVAAAGPLKQNGRQADTQTFDRDYWLVLQECAVFILTIQCGEGVEAIAASTPFGNAWVSRQESLGNAKRLSPKNEDGIIVECWKSNAGVRPIQQDINSAADRFYAAKLH